MIRHALFWLSIYILFSACNPEKGHERLSPIDTLSFSLPNASGLSLSEVYHQQVMDSNGILREALSFIDYEQNCLYIADYRRGTILYNIPLLSYYIKTSGDSSAAFINGYYIKNIDSIFFLLNPPTNRIVLANRDSLFRYWNVPFITKDKESFEIFSAYNQAPIVLSNDTFITQVQLSNPYYMTDERVRRLKYSVGTDAAIKIKNDTAVILAQFGSFPEPYTDGNFYYDVIPARVMNDRKQLIYSFGANDTVFVYSTGGKLLQKKNAESKYKTNATRFDPSNENLDRYTERYLAEEFRYQNVLYLPSRKSYLRQCLHSIKYEDGAYVNLFIDKPWSLMLLDSDLSVKQEYFFEPKQYDFYNLLVVNDTLLVGLQNNNNENKVSFVRFKL